MPAFSPVVALVLLSGGVPNQHHFHQHLAATSEALFNTRRKIPRPLCICLRVSEHVIHARQQQRRAYNRKLSTIKAARIKLITARAGSRRKTRVARYQTHARDTGKSTGRNNRKGAVASSNVHADWRVVPVTAASRCISWSPTNHGRAFLPTDPPDTHQPPQYSSVMGPHAGRRSFPMSHGVREDPRSQHSRTKHAHACRCCVSPGTPTH